MRYDYDGNSVGKKEILIEVFITIFEIAVVVAAAFLIVRFGLETMGISGSNMEPTLMDGDNILINKMSYKLHSVKRNDVVVVKQDGSEHNYYVVQRVIGLPGEKVKISNGEVYINGKVLDEKYNFPLMKNGGLALEEITLDDDEYFMLCDNRNDCEDSRNASVGNVLKSNIVGKAWIRTNSFAFISSIDGFKKDADSSSDRTK